MNSAPTPPESRPTRMFAAVCMCSGCVLLCAACFSLVLIESSLSVLLCVTCLLLGLSSLLFGYARLYQPKNTYVHLQRHMKARQLVRYSSHRVVSSSSC